MLARFNVSFFFFFSSGTKLWGYILLGPVFAGFFFQASGYFRRAPSRATGCDGFWGSIGGYKGHLKFI